MGMIGNILQFLCNLSESYNKHEEITHSEQLEQYYNKKYPTKPIFYSGRYLYGSNTRFKVDVRDFFTLNDENLNNIVKVVTKPSMTDNQKALSCLKYIIQNIPYKSDSTNYGKNEFWEFPFEVLAKKSCDCEGMSILLANLLLISGIPSWKVRINCGWVFEPISKKEVGHAYVTFFDETTEKWVILDCCYYPNLDIISKREEYKKDKRYRDVWFSFNDKLSWAKEDADVRQMKGFNNE